MIANSLVWNNNHVLDRIGLFQLRIFGNDMLSPSVIHSKTVDFL